jgi:hypothetical protein
MEEIQPNSISWQAKLSAIVGMMFFAPLVKYNLKRDFDYSEEEKNFITWYIQVGFVNLIFLVITLIATLINIFWTNPVLPWIITVGSLVVYIITIVSLFSCINGLTMRKSDETVKINIQHKWQLLKAYTPILNFILRFRQENYNMPYRWLKESILLRTIFIFWTLLFGNYFWIWVLWVMIVRVGLLMLNIDIIPLSIKKATNSAFLCNPWEITAYLFSLLVSKIKKSDYNTILQARKQSYIQWQSFWLWIIIQYILFMAILYLIYYTRIAISWERIVLLVAAILWIIRIIVFYKYKKTFLKIPILAEITSLVFH